MAHAGGNYLTQSQKATKKKFRIFTNFLCVKPFPKNLPPPLRFTSFSLKTIRGFVQVAALPNPKRRKPPLQILPKNRTVNCQLSLIFSYVRRRIFCLLIWNGTSIDSRGLHHPGLRCTRIRNRPVSVVGSASR